MQFLFHIQDVEIFECGILEVVSLRRLPYRSPLCLIVRQLGLIIGRSLSISVWRVFPSNQKPLFWSSVSWVPFWLKHILITTSTDNLCLKCDGNASCIYGKCICNKGFIGDGITCTGEDKKIKQDTFSIFSHFAMQNKVVLGEIQQQNIQFPMSQRPCFQTESKWQI